MTSYDSAKEELKKTVDIVELVGQYVQLKKGGKNYVGLCPFHSEKAPSFSVSPSRQMFHCFGCKKGGDVFAFWMAYHGVGFPEALRDLAEKYGVEIPEADVSPGERRRRDQREAIYKANELAALYFHKILTGSEKGDAGRAYFARRALDEEIVARFRLGYAPEEWEGLTSFLRRRGVGAETAVQAGLIIPRKNGGHYDRFRGRVIFPIFNLKEQIEGFGGRVLDQKLPKYLNTPETPVFHKGASLYGLQAACQHVREEGRIVVVEGYMDFLALWRHGLNGAAATLGTALTEEHVRRMKGYAKEAVVVFDSDEAGKKAALRSLPIFMNEGLPARAVVLPEGHDPDSFVNAFGLSRFRALLDQAIPLFDFYIEQALSGAQEGVEGKLHALKEIMPILAELRDETQIALYAQHLSERMGIREEVVWAGLKGVKKPDSGAALDFRPKDRPAAAQVKRGLNHDLQFLNLLLHFPPALERLAENEWELLVSDAAVREIVKALFRKHRDEGPFPVEAAAEAFSGAVQELFREALLQPPLYSEQEVELAVAEFEGKIRQIKLSRAIRKARDRGDTERLVELTKLKAQSVKAYST